MFCRCNINTTIDIEGYSNYFLDIATRLLQLAKHRLIEHVQMTVVVKILPLIFLVISSLARIRYFSSLLWIWL